MQHCELDNKNVAFEYHWVIPNIWIEEKEERIENIQGHNFEAAKTILTTFLNMEWGGPLFCEIEARNP